MKGKTAYACLCYRLSCLQPKPHRSEGWDSRDGGWLGESRSEVGQLGGSWEPARGRAGPGGTGRVRVQRGPGGRWQQQYVRAAGGGAAL